MRDGPDGQGLPLLGAVYIRIYTPATARSAAFSKSFSRFLFTPPGSGPRPPVRTLGPGSGCGSGSDSGTHAPSPRATDDVRDEGERTIHDAASQSLPTGQETDARTLDEQGSSPPAEKVRNPSFAAVLDVNAKQCTLASMALFRSWLEISIWYYSIFVCI